MSLKAVIFDMDGTITKPVLDFEAIRLELGLESLEHITHQLSELSEERQAKAWGIIHKHEANAMILQELQPGFLDVLELCRAHGLKVGLLTLNLRKSVELLCEKFDLSFDGIITREFEFIKPSPKPLLHLLDQWQLEPSESFMIGDYIHDIECANNAGATSCYLFNPDTEDFSDQANFTVKSMADLHDLLTNLLLR